MQSSVCILEVGPNGIGGKDTRVLGVQESVRLEPSSASRTSLAGLSQGGFVRFLGTLQRCLRRDFPATEVLWHTFTAFMRRGLQDARLGFGSDRRGLTTLG